mgnify:CR=1 FL=1
MPCAIRHAGCQGVIVLGIFEPQDFLGRDAVFFQFAQGQINSAALRVIFNIPENVCKLKGLPLIYGIIAACWNLV